MAEITAGYNDHSQTSAEPDPHNLHLIVENVHCPGCIRKIEGALREVPGVINARMNLTTKRLAVRYQETQVSPDEIIAVLKKRDYQAVAYDTGILNTARSLEDRRLLWALAVSGFAAANVMILSIAVWVGSDMGESTRQLLHWVSALIALPTLVYAGRPFFKSALGSLKGRTLNMDVPISLAIILAAGMSLWDTFSGAHEVYFDAAISLVFFLLIGRVLDRQMRRRASDVVENLMGLKANTANVLEADGSMRSVAVDQLWPDMVVAVAPGERVPVDGLVLSGKSDVDTALIDGESVPKSVADGAHLFAGALNLTGSLRIKVTHAGEDTLLADIIRQMEAAEQSRAKYVRLADRAAGVYAPSVHIISALAFLGWWLIGDASWQESLRIAISVLIITCPCALGLAVPAVQVVASGLLFRLGILLKSGDALERLGEVDAVILDKTGTLSEGKPVLMELQAYDPAVLNEAARLAASSHHPLSRALVAATGGAVVPYDGAREEPGMGLEVDLEGTVCRLGNRAWCAITEPVAGTDEGYSELWYAKAGSKPVCFRFSDELKPDAAEAVRELAAAGYKLCLASGDRAGAVKRAASQLGISNWLAALRPADKKNLLTEQTGQRVLMVGDGMNDAPALSAAHVSVAFARGADVAQAAADMVFQNPRLSALPLALSLAKVARRAILENFTLALIYNMIAVPLAVSGLVTPLIAAIAMSSSSLIVTGNALRLRLSKPGKKIWTSSSI